MEINGGTLATGGRMGAVGTCEGMRVVLHVRAGLQIRHDGG